MEVRLPPLGEGADSGSVASIFVKVGDSVGKDQPVLELESEKAVASIPSPASGIVAEILVKEGDEVKVGQVLLTLQTAAVAGEGEKDSDSRTISVAPSGRLVKESVVSQPVSPEIPIVRTPGIPPPAAPSVRRLARELGIDLSLVRGTEKGGRIIMADLRRYIDGLQQVEPTVAIQQTAGATPAVVTEAVEGIDVSRWGSSSRKKLSVLRQTISRRMVESWRTIPHVTQFHDADVTDIERLRKIYDPLYKKRGARLTLTPFIIRAIVSVLKKFPVFNASLDISTNELVLKEYYHIGIAVDTEQGLMVPVIRDADKKTLLMLSTELLNLGDRARQRKLTMEEMQGGSFTISNQGAIGGKHFTPIINMPEVAILGVGRGGEHAVAGKLRIEKRILLPLALSYDHRVIDGADAARFITALEQELASFKDTDVRLEQ
jgi:pyruvate dehydrogenase E2 component (dihydrolipoamide acetyltransferase)